MFTFSSFNDAAMAASTSKSSENTGEYAASLPEGETRERRTMEQVRMKDGKILGTMENVLPKSSERL